MFKHFNFYIFLTTLGIVSVTHALDLQFLAEMMKLAEQKEHLLKYSRNEPPKPQSYAPPQRYAPPQNSAPPQNYVPQPSYAGRRSSFASFPSRNSQSFGSRTNYPIRATSPTATKAPETATSNDSYLNELQNSVKYTSQDWGGVSSGGLKIAGKPEVIVTSVTRCWVDGNLVELQPGDPCDGLSQVMNAATASSYTPSFSPTPSTPMNREYTRQPSRTYSRQFSFEPEYARRPLTKQTSFNYPWPSPPSSETTRPTWQPTQPTWQPTQPTWQPTRPTWEPTQTPTEPKKCYDCTDKRSTEPPSTLPTVLSSPSPITTTTETIAPPPSVSPLPSASSFPSPWGSARRFGFGPRRWGSFGNDDTTNDTPKDKEENTSTAYSTDSPNYWDRPKIVKQTSTTTDPNESFEKAIENLLRENSGNTTTTEQKIPAGSKIHKINGEEYIASLPEEKPIEYHSDETPLGLTKSEVVDIRNEVLTRNNYYRTKFGIRPLKLNDYMNNHAQEWANKLASMNRLRSRSSTENDLYTQNTFAYGKKENIGNIAVDTWYNQLRFIKVNDDEEDFKKNPENIGHMITLLWKGSRDIGIGVAKSVQKMYFIVADYNPQGYIYPFVKDNLPAFKQSDIEDAKNAHSKSGTQVQVVNSNNGPPLEGTVITTTAILPDPNDYYKNFGEPKTHSYKTPLRMSDDEVRLIRKDVIEKTNYYRRIYGMPDLVENNDLNNYAQEWANTLGSIQNYFDHRPSGTRLYGENLHMSNDFLHVGEIAADLWYYEVGLVHENDTEEELFNNHGAGHLTQLLWQRSKQVGCGAAKYPDQKVVIACNYNPKGNVQGLYLTNLPRFSYEQIEDGKIKDAIANSQKQRRIDMPPPGQKLKFPDWISALYPNESPQKVSPVPQSTGQSSVTNGRSLDSSVQPVPTDKSPANDSDAYYAIHYRDPKPYSYSTPLRLTNQDVDIIRDDVLRKSNEYRIKYDMPELVLNNDINNYSQEWANYLAKFGQFEHRPDNGTRIYGENLHKSNDFEHVGEIAVDLWYYEIGLVHENDTEEDLRNNDDAGHLTQLLWKRSKQMGCGAAKYADGKIIIACNYNPTGNVQGLYKQNLPTFIQTQINEGIELQKVMNEQALKQHNTPLPGQKRKLAGWNSSLYASKSSNGLHNITLNEVNEIRQDVLNKCNFYREKHYVPVLTLSEEINKSAQEWANHLGRTGAYSRKSSEQACSYGENMLALPNVIHVGEVAVDIWYYKMAYLQGNENELKFFANVDSRDVTQLLWKATTTMGVGVSRYENHNIIIVAFFNPAGNIRNEFRSNVPTFSISEIFGARSKLEAVDRAKGAFARSPPTAQPRAVPNWTSDLYP